MDTDQFIKKARYKLPWDFYLPEYMGLIEFDGEHHFMPNDHWGGEKAFRETQKNDARKTKWAIENDYHLVRIRFDQVEEIQDILRAEFPV